MHIKNVSQRIHTIAKDTHLQPGEVMKVEDKIGERLLSICSGEIQESEDPAEMKKKAAARAAAKEKAEQEAAAKAAQAQ